LRAVADAEEAGEPAGRQAEPDQRRRVARAQPHGGIAAGAAARQHQRGDGQHQQREKKNQPAPVDHLAQRRARQRTRPAGQREHQRAAPFHSPRARVADETQHSVSRHRDRARADRQMRLRHADHVKQERRRHDRSAAAHQPEQEADQRPRSDRKRQLSGRHPSNSGL
jgi:hypothetical protein